MNNSEILFLYDAKLCNPNGDPDDENRPRMDYETEKNLVSDLRIKRYIRDYLGEKGHEIFVSKPEDKAVTATQRLESIFEAKTGNKKIDISSRENMNMLLDTLIDIRLFGATLPIKGTEGKGMSGNFIGPVQFNWGYSLNKVQLVDSNGITSHFSSEANKGQGAMGKDYRVYYSFLAFHGIVSAKRGEKTNLKEEDIKLLDESLVKAIPLMATRSKVGQYPRLLIRIEYTDDETFIGDFRDYITIENYETEYYRNISDFHLNIRGLINILNTYKNRIKSIHIWGDEALRLSDGNKIDTFENLLPSELKSKLKSII